MPSGGKPKAKMPPKKVDMRSLMQQRKQATVEPARRVDSPLARYSAAGQLSCVVCRTPVKSELAWTGHLASRSHKEHVAALRSQGEKRPAADNQRPTKRARPGIPDGFFQTPAPPPKKGILKNAPPLRPPPSKPAVAARLAPPQP